MMMVMMLMMIMMTYDVDDDEYLSIYFQVFLLLTLLKTIKTYHISIQNVMSRFKYAVWNQHFGALFKVEQSSIEKDKREYEWVEWTRTRNWA